MHRKILFIDVLTPFSMVSVCALMATLAGCVGSSDPGPATPEVQPGASAPPPPATLTPPPLVTPPFAQLRCSPCTKVVFTSSRDGNSEIYSVNADGTELTRLTNSTSYDDFAVWSPDGTRIAFTSGDFDDYLGRELRVMNADGSNVIRHTLPHGVLDPTWSPDGTRITYSSLSNGSANIWTVDADGGWPMLLFSLPGWEGHPSWAPDGSKLAVVSDWLAFDFVSDIFLVDPDGAGFALLTDGNIFDHLDYFWPAWSPDGTKISLSLSYTLGVDRYASQIGVINHDGGGLTPLISLSGPTPSNSAFWFGTKTSWSPDGTMIAFTSLSADASTANVSWVNADGSAWGTIITSGLNPDWQR